MPPEVISTMDELEPELCILRRSCESFGPLFVVLQSLDISIASLLPCEEAHLCARELILVAVEEERIALPGQPLDGFRAHARSERRESPEHTEWIREQQVACSMWIWHNALRGSVGERKAHQPGR